MKRPVLLVVALALAGLVLFAWQRLRTGEKTPLTLGYVSSLSGRFSALSGSGRDGAVLAVDKVNARGGVAGRTLQLSIKDSAFDQDKAAKAVSELARERVPAVIGPFSSAMARPMIQVASELGMLVVSPTVSSDEFTGKDDLFLRLIPTTADYSAALGRHIARERGVKKLAVLVDTANAAYSLSASRFTREGFLGGGGTDFAVIEYDSRQSPSIQALAAQAAGARPDGILMISGPLDTAIMCQHLRLAAPDLPLFSSTWGMSSELIENGGRAVEGLESVVPFDPESATPAYQEFVKEFSARFGRQPDFASMYNYETVMLLARALAQDPGAKGEELKKVILSQNPHQGLQSPYSLDRFGDVSRPLYLLAVMDGRFKVRK